MFSSPQQHGDGAYKGFEMDPIERNDHSWKSLISMSADPEMVAKTRECQRILQDGHPTFVPTFSSLRARCLKRTSDRLLEINRKLEIAEEEDEESKLLDQASRLLEDLDKQFNAIADRHQLEDPDYAAERGLSLTHFAVESGAKEGNWMLLTSNWGKGSTSITESDPELLSGTKKEWLRDFCDGDIPPVIAFKRRKNLLERQRGAITEKGKVFVPNKKMIKFWAILLGVGFVAEILFLGVGIIATTTTFSPTFVTFFFWICILWTLLSSGLLVLLVRAFGANGRDALGAFLAALAIWLVVIQIGQTKLNGQLNGDK